MISQDLLDALLEFRRERDWEKFHTIRNLSAALCVESAELLDHFRWVRDSEQDNIIVNQRAEIEDELADVTILLSYIFHDLGISAEDAVVKKLSQNRKKYPVEKARGISTKYYNL